MSQRITEDDKFVVGDLVEVTGEMACYSYSRLNLQSRFSYVGLIGTVISHERCSRHGMYKWQLTLKFPEILNKVNFYTKYKFTDAKVRPVFKV